MTLEPGWIGFDKGYSHEFAQLCSRPSTEFMMSIETCAYSGAADSEASPDIEDSIPSAAFPT